MTTTAIALPIWVKQARNLESLLVHMRDHNDCHNKKIDLPGKVFEFFLRELDFDIPPSKENTSDFSVSGQLPTGVELATDLRLVTLAILNSPTGNMNIPVKFWTLFDTWLQGSSLGDLTTRVALSGLIQKMIYPNNSANVYGTGSGKTAVTWDLINVWHQWMTEF